MAFYAKMEVEGKTYELLECISELEQKIDAKGRPVSSVRGGKIRMAIRGTDDEVIPNWATDKTKKNNGVITFLKYDQQSKFKEIKFEEAYITWFSESFFADQEMEEIFEESMIKESAAQEEMYQLAKRAHERFKIGYIFLVRITAKKIEIDGIQHINR